MPRSVEISGCPAYNKTRRGSGPEHLGHMSTVRRSAADESCCSYVRHSSIRSDMVPDTKNLTGLVPRIGAEGIRENDINIPTAGGTEREPRIARTRGRDRQETELSGPASVLATSLVSLCPPLGLVLAGRTPAFEKPANSARFPGIDRTSRLPERRSPGVIKEDDLIPYRSPCCLHPGPVDYLRSRLADRPVVSVRPGSSACSPLFSPVFLPFGKNLSPGDCWRSDN